MYTNKENAKSVEQIKQDYEQAVDHPGLVEFIQKVHSTDKAEANKLEYKVSDISKRQKNDIEKITGEPMSAISNFIKGGTIVILF